MDLQLGTLSLLLLLALLGGAVVSDFRWHRIPNWMSGTLLGLGVLLQFELQAWNGLAAAMAGLMIGLLAFLPFYLRSAMGAGDVKLMAAAGAWLGPLGAVLACGLTLVAGLVMVLMIFGWRALCMRQPALAMASSKLPLSHLGSLLVERNGRLKVPYAPAIALGVFLSGWHLNLTGFIWN
ncbi:MAG: hypothetical protein GWP58_14950 [Gammaproteobacteria bacterium]|jgi:prepilin peptidase CpaA|nr:hypothetical protein [Gammaproteobacteria bacterium]